MPPMQPMPAIGPVIPIPGPLIAPMPAAPPPMGFPLLGADCPESCEVPAPELRFRSRSLLEMPSKKDPPVSTPPLGCPGGMPPAQGPGPAPMQPPLKPPQPGPPPGRGAAHPPPGHPPPQLPWKPVKSPKGFALAAKRSGIGALCAGAGAAAGTDAGAAWKVAAWKGALAKRSACA